MNATLLCCACLIVGFVVGLWFAGHYINKVSDQIMRGE